MSWQWKQLPPAPACIGSHSSCMRCRGLVPRHEAALEPPLPTPPHSCPASPAQHLNLMVAVRPEEFEMRANTRPSRDACISRLVSTCGATEGRVVRLHGCCGC